MGTPSSERIIQDVDVALKALEMVYHENGAVVEGLDDRKSMIKILMLTCLKLLIKIH